MEYEKDIETGLEGEASFCDSFSFVLRPYRPSDCGQVLQLFYDTVHTVNARDYTAEQLDAWADGKPDEAVWNNSLTAHFSLAAEAGGVLAGFGDIDETGYLDRLYVHRDFQGRGIGTAVCEALEQEAVRVMRQRQEERPLCITTHASITARPFFEARGYQVKQEQQVERKGVLLTNYVMEKRMQKRQKQKEKSV